MNRMEILEEVIKFFRENEFVFLATLDSRGKIHISIKGLIKVERDGKFYIFDLYKGRTYRNLKNNPQATISAVDEHRFRGYALQGIAEIVNLKNVSEEIHKLWEKNVARRISKRLSKTVKKGISSPGHPEMKFPPPRYLILFIPQKIIDLAPRSNF